MRVTEDLPRREDANCTIVSKLKHLAPGRGVFEPHGCPADDNAVVEDHAFVGSMVTLRGQARVGGRAVITDGVNLRDESYVGGSTYLRGPIVVEGKCRVVNQTLRSRFVIH